MTHIQENTFKVHFKNGTLGKKVALFSSGFDIKKNSSSDDTLNTIFEIYDSSSNVPNSILCKISNEKWKGNFMVRDNRKEHCSTFGYNSTGGEKFKLVFATPLASIVNADPLRFYARLYVIGKGDDHGSVFGVYSDGETLKWGPEGLAEVVEIVSTKWS